MLAAAHMDRLTPSRVVQIALGSSLLAMLPLQLKAELLLLAMLKLLMAKLNLEKQQNLLRLRKNLLPLLHLRIKRNNI